MKTLIVALTLFLAPSELLMGQEHLPSSLSELSIMLPTLVHKQHFDFGIFSDAVWHSIQNDPSSITRAIPSLSQNLDDSDEKVRFYTIAILQTLASRADSRSLVIGLSPKLNNALASTSESTQVITLLAITNLGRDAPDNVIQPTESLLTSKATTDKVVLASAQALSIMRPQDDKAQNTIINVIHNTDRSEQLRRQMLFATARPDSGPLLVNNIVEAVLTTGNIQMRDAAIAAAYRVGSPATSRVQTRLREIAADPAESLASHRIAYRALNGSNSK